MNPVEARLRSWAGNLRNGAYRQRVLEAADEIKRLSEVNAELRYSVQGRDELADTTITQLNAAKALNAELLAACRSREAVDFHFRSCRECGADLRGNTWKCDEWNRLTALADRLNREAIASAERTTP